MGLIIYIENFIGIKKMEIEMADLVLLLGNNNSGKTRTMELIYGVYKYISDLNIPYEKITKEKNDEYYAGEEWIINVESYINKQLSTDKDVIVLNTFKKKIPVGDISVKIDKKSTFHFSIKEEEYASVTKIQQKGDMEQEIPWKVEIRTDQTGEVHIYKVRGTVDLKRIETAIASLVLFMIISSRNKNFSNIYLPASRTGLQMLHKYYYLSRKKEQNSDDMIVIEPLSKDNQGDYSLTAPVEDYLDFIYNYQKAPKLSNGKSELLKFLESELFDGKIKKEGKELFYNRKKVDGDIPLYLSSSMVNELAPLYQVLSGGKDFGTIFYDEIEMCLHPLKQKNMARFIIRMINNGYRMIVSTHSDNMASFFNLLLLLAGKSGVDLDELDFNDKDVLKDKSFRIYEFVRDNEGETTIKPLDFNAYPASGVDFPLFDKNLKDLYQITKKIIGGYEG